MSDDVPPAGEEFPEGPRMRELRVVPVSPDRYCPLCRRLLVKMNDDGTFALAGRAQVQMVTTTDPFNLPEDDEIEGFLEATCMLRRCRFRRWRERANKQLLIAIAITILALVLNMVVVMVSSDRWANVIGVALIGVALGSLISKGILVGFSRRE